jgi:hypothetical protein
MKIYSNGFKIDINEIVTITFLDGYQAHELKVVSEIAMQLDILKQLRDTMINLIDQHQSKLDHLKKSN